uniref:C-type lectin domain-containing protein n=1 Tax=Panagrolaimus superbus TaxID=310955 RepID=A0A914Y4L4_9BILA
MAAAKCPSNTTEWQSSCFSFYANATGFADAELICAQTGGHLASIHDGFANALLALKKILEEANKHFHESTITDFWIGATNLLGSKAWNWTDGSGIDFTDWKKGEPQNISGSNCAALSISDGYWTAEDCFKSKPFSCSTSTTPTYPLTANCSQGWTYFAPTHSCYGVNAGGPLNSWTVSENYCEKNVSHLPSIHSFAEYQFILSKFKYFLSI